MISDGGKQLYRTLRLPARDAARRFAPRGVRTKALELLWRPIVLQWRKPGKNLRTLIRRGGSSTIIASFPQFHLHFMTYHTHENSSGSWRKSSSPARVFDTRMFREELSKRGGASLSTSWNHLDYSGGPRSSNDLFPSIRTPRDFHTPHSFRSKSSKAPPTGAQLPPAHMFLFSRTVVTGFHPLSSRQTVGRRFRTQLRIPQCQPMRQGTRSRDQENARTNQIALTRLSAPQQYRRTEELVWRRVSQTTTETSKRVRDLDSMESRERPPVHSATNQQTAATEARALEQAAATLTTLHPALMDRLANDVIRRVEQRVRIERERRGL
jgi:hypothetical protein